MQQLFMSLLRVDRLKAFRLKVVSGYFGCEGRRLWGIRRRRIMRVSSTAGLPHEEEECPMTVSLHTDYMEPAGLGSRGKSLVVRRHHKVGGGLFPPQQRSGKVQRIQGAKSGWDRL